MFLYMSVTYEAVDSEGELDFGKEPVLYMK